MSVKTCQVYCRLHTWYLTFICKLMSESAYLILLLSKMSLQYLHSRHITVVLV